MAKKLPYGAYKKYATKRYNRYRVESPTHFTAFRLKDVGRIGHTKLVIGKTKKKYREKGKSAWKVQSVIKERD